MTTTYHPDATAFAGSLDLTFVVAAGFGLVATLIVLAFVRPRPARVAASPDRESVTARA